MLFIQPEWDRRHFITPEWTALKVNSQRKKEREIDKVQMLLNLSDCTLWNPIYLIILWLDMGCMYPWLEPNFVSLTRFLPSNDRNKDLQENYCRNPADDEGGPWCFTMDPKIRLESCAIPQCSEGNVLSFEVHRNLFCKCLNIAHKNRSGKLSAWF